jgi:hypothetical protein
VLVNDQRDRLRPVILVLVGAVLGTCLARPADAGVVSGTRSSWAVGAGWNFGRGTFELTTGDQQRYREGSSSQIRVGRLLGDHFQVGVDYQGWAVEFADVDIEQNPVKFRRSLQNLSVSVTVYPGKPGSAWGGWYVRGGAGLGWSGTGAKEVNLGEETKEGVRKDEWGVGYLAETGYELWVVRHFSIAPGLAFNYFQIGGEDYPVGTATVRGVDRAGFLAAQITFNVYFGGE